MSWHHHSTAQGQCGVLRGLLCLELELLPHESPSPLPTRPHRYDSCTLRSLGLPLVVRYVVTIGIFSMQFVINY